MLVLLLCAAGTAAALPPEFSARYQVSHSGFTLGEARTHFKRIGEQGYSYSSLTRPSGIASLFYKVEIKEVSRGRITASGFRPDSYSYRRRGKGARAATLTFDWQQQRVTNDVDGSTWRMKIPHDTLDRMVSQLQLMHDLANGEDRLSYRVADGRKEIRRFDFEILGREEIDTVYGRLQAVKIARKQDDDERATTFWCAPELDYLPVRIEHREKNDEFTMSLREADGFGPRTGAAAPAAPALLPKAAMAAAE